MSADGYRFPEHDYPSEVELWLESDGLVRVRAGVRVIEFTPQEARDLGLALTELANAAERV